MATLAEKARAEAEAAEAEEQEQAEGDEPEQPAEEPAAEPGDEPEPEPAPDPAEGLEEPTDQMIAELQASCADHHDHVRQIMGGFVEGWVACETCNGIGIAYPTPSGPKLEPAPGLQLCTVCKGAGELGTPSTRDNYGVIQCVNCAGKGYTGQLQGSQAAAQAAVETYPQQVEGQPAELAQPAPVENTDPFVAEAEQRGYIVLKKPGA